MVLRKTLEIKRCDIVEQHLHTASEHGKSVLDTDPLNRLLLRVVEFVKITVYFAEVDVLVKMAPEIFGSGHLAHRLAQPGRDKITQDSVIDTVEANRVVNLVQNEFRAVQQNRVDVVQDSRGTLFFKCLAASLLEVKFKKAKMSLYPFSASFA